MLALNQNLQSLVTVAQKHVKTGIGLMTRTSLDGLDIALCQFTGTSLQTHFKLLQFVTIPYIGVFKNEVRSVFAKRQVDLEKVCLLNAYIGTYHGDLVLRALAEWQIKPADIDFIASHGQ